MRIYTLGKLDKYYIIIDNKVYSYFMSNHRLVRVYNATEEDIIRHPDLYTDVTPDELYDVEIFIPSIEEYIQSEVFGELDEDGCMDFMAASAKQKTYHRCK